MDIKQRLKTQRKECGLTQEELAAKINVSVMSVRRLEWGKNCPRSDELQKLAEALGTTCAYLLGESEDARPGQLPLPSPEPVKTQRVSTYKGMLRYKFSNGQEIEVPNTPENAAMFWEIVRGVIGLPAASAGVSV